MFTPGEIRVLGLVLAIGGAAWLLMGWHPLAGLALIGVGWLLQWRAGLGD